MKRLKVFVVEDEIWVRRGILFRLSQMSDFVDTVGEAETHREALDAFSALDAVDVLLSDIVLSDGNGLELIGAVKRERPSLLTYIISGYSEFQYAQKAISLGVNGYLLKPLQEGALKQEMEAAHRLIYPDRPECFLDLCALEQLRELSALPEESEMEALIASLLSPIKALYADKTLVRRAIEAALGEIESTFLRFGVMASEIASVRGQYADASGYYENFESWIAFVVADLADLAARRQQWSLKSGKTFISEIKRYIRLHCQDDLTLESLSSHFAISPAYLSRIFKASGKEGFSEYLSRVRMEAACTLLRESDLSTAMIAERFNYADASYFAKVFRKYVGCTPSAYRKRVE